MAFVDFAKSLNVSGGYLRHREPILTRIYIEEFKRQETRARRMIKRLAKSELTYGGALLRYTNGEIKSQDQLVDHLHVRTGVKKHVARLLISQSLVTQVRLQALAAKSQLKKNERTMLRRGHASGYI